MKALVIGNGGREHAIAWKLAQSPLVDKIYCAPGNGGTHFENKCTNVNLETIEELFSFAKSEAVDFTVVGPEAKLVEGIVDVFKAAGLKIFGPAKQAAMLEGSKIFAKDFMKKYGVKTAQYAAFDTPTEALKYIESCNYPAVVKADGLAAGKGVIICSSYEEAKAAIEDLMIKCIFKASGKKIIVEEFLEGVEASILSITDGNTIIPFISSKDHKQIFDENKGPNTGGMGAIAPNPYCTAEVLEAFNKDILLPTLQGIKAENMDYSGIIFFGLMINKRGVYLLEYNVRMGDPETQAVLPLMESDFAELILAAIHKDLDGHKILWKNGAACCVVAASDGYPKSYKTGLEIKIEKASSGKVFIAGAEYKEDELKTSGGRVLAAADTGATLEESIKKAYVLLESVNFDKMYFRHDIGKIY